MAWGMPMPVSQTVTRMPLASRTARIPTVPPRGVYYAALSSRFKKTCARRVASALSRIASLGSSALFLPNAHWRRVPPAQRAEPRGAGIAVKNRVSLRRCRSPCLRPYPDSDPESKPIPNTRTANPMHATRSPAWWRSEEATERLQRSQGPSSGRPCDRSRHGSGSRGPSLSEPPDRARSCGSRTKPISAAPASSWPK